MTQETSPEPTPNSEAKGETGGTQASASPAPLSEMDAPSSQVRAFGGDTALSKSVEGAEDDRGDHVAGDPQ